MNGGLKAAMSFKFCSQNLVLINLLTFIVIAKSTKVSKTGKRTLKISKSKGVTRWRNSKKKEYL